MGKGHTPSPAFAFASDVVRTLDCNVIMDVTVAIAARKPGARAKIPMLAQLPGPIRLIFRPRAANWGVVFLEFVVLLEFLAVHQRNLHWHGAPHREQRGWTRGKKERVRLSLEGS